MNTSNITLCLTIGKRPELLKQTLESLLDKVSFEHIIAINDFSDEETNHVFKTLCPQGKLISLNQNLGHHKAIDYMYSLVKTDYVFHCEDDWFFDKLPNIQDLIKILDNHPEFTCISLRQKTDFGFSEKELALIQEKKVNHIELLDFTDLHEQWHGYTFNPHIASLKLWKSYSNGFKPFKKERHISRDLRKQNRYMPYLKDGACHHIGYENSIANPPPKNFFSKIKAKIMG